MSHTTDNDPTRWPTHTVSQTVPLPTSAEVEAFLAAEGLPRFGSVILDAREVDELRAAQHAATKRAVLAGVTHYHALQTQPHRVCVDFATPEQADAFAALLDTHLAGGDE